MLGTSGCAERLARTCDRTVAPTPASRVVTGKYDGVVHVESLYGDVYYEAAGVEGQFLREETAAEEWDGLMCGTLLSHNLNFPKLHEPYFRCNCAEARGEARTAEGDDVSVGLGAAPPSPHKLGSETEDEGGLSEDPCLAQDEPQEPTRRAQEQPQDEPARDEPEAREEQARREVRAVLSMEIDPMAERTDVQWVVGEFSRQWVGRDVCAVSMLVWLVAVHAAAWSPTRRAFWEREVAMCAWRKMRFGRAARALARIASKLRMCEANGQPKDMAAAKDMGQAQRWVSPQELAELLRCRKTAPALRKYCKYLSKVVWLRRVGDGNRRQAILRRGRCLRGRKKYLNPHVLGALCLACDVEPGGNSHQEMGAGFTQAKIDELEQVTGPGIRNLQVLCGLKLNWRTVAFRYCARLKATADRKKFLANLAILKERTL
jgi:hypothetical protein